MTESSGLLEAFGFITYRLLLTDFLPGLGMSILLAYYLRDQAMIQDFLCDVRFLKDAAWGLPLALALFAIVLGLGVVVNLLSALLLQRAAVDCLFRTKVVGWVDPAEAIDRIAADCDDELSAGSPRLRGRIFEVDRAARRIRNQLNESSPGLYQRLERYQGAAILSRSLAGLTLVTTIGAVFRADWVLASTLLPIVLILLLGSAYAFNYGARETLEAGRYLNGTDHAAS